MWEMWRRDKSSTPLVYHIFHQRSRVRAEWLEAGDLLHVEWRPEVIVLRVTGHDDEVQREETLFLTI